MQGTPRLGDGRAQVDSASTTYFWNNKPDQREDTFTQYSEAT